MSFQHSKRPRYTTNSGNSRRRVFTKLLKDETASVRNRNDAIRFLDGMETFIGEEATQLLMKLDDKRDQGPRRIHEILSFVDSVEECRSILVRFLSQAMTPLTARPLFVGLRNRVLIQVYSVPLLMQTIYEVEAAILLTGEDAATLCSYLEAVSSCLMEARSNSFVINIAKQFGSRGDIDSRALRSLVLIEPPDVTVQHHTNVVARSQGPSSVVWISDERPPGGRHDNDHLNFRNVRLLPTAQELRCETRPWLPLATGANNFIRDPTTRLASNNFRLLREDAIFAMKDKINNRYRPWTNARIVDLDVSVRKGLIAFVVQLDPRKQTINWEFSRSLSHGNIVALCENNIPTLMGSICTREVKMLQSKEGPCIGVSFDTHGDHFEDALRLLIDAKQRPSASKECKNREKGSQPRFHLIEASTSFATYLPVLSSLQKMTSMPFVEELCGHNTERTEVKLDHLPQTMRMPEDKVCNGYELNLTSTTVHDICLSTTLDQSQADAVLHAFKNRVSLIQGPPGTGKTFIGGLIARMIRENTDESILCLCYTNHALDQFLEHMIDAGENRLVRIGSRSRSDRVSAYNLTSLARQKTQTGLDHNRRFKQIEAQMHGLKKSIEECMESIMLPLTWNSQHGGVKQYLQEEDLDLLRCFSLPSADSDFVIAGANGKKLSDDFLWKCWNHGEDFPVYLTDYMPTDIPRFEEFWSMEPNKRIDIVNQWKTEIIKGDVDYLQVLVKEFQDLCLERRSIKEQQNLQILLDSRIIGATTTGAAQYKELLNSKKPGVIIVEEAGEVLEAHVVSALQADSTKHLILIGDHMQLRPKVETYQLTTVSDMGYTFDRSLFERLVLSDVPSVTLRVQHRMRPTISNIIRMQTYPDLIDHASVENFPDLQGVNNNVVFVDHRNFEDFEDEIDGDVPSTSKSNTYEVDMCLSIAKYLMQQGYRPGRLAILTPYLGQLHNLVRRLKTEIRDATAFLSERNYRDLEDLEERERDDEQLIYGSDSLRCSSIDNFQGEEADIVIISLVRSNKKGNIGFLKEAQRVNVLLSRARIGMIIVGNAETLRASNQGRQVWEPILDLLSANSSVQKGLPTCCPLHPDDKPLLLSETNDFLKFRPNGGCSKTCGQRMECGHQCRLSCHPFDREHTQLTARMCVRACRRIPTECTENHSCSKLCNEDCGPCTHTKGPFLLVRCNHWIDNIVCHDVRDEEAINKLSEKCFVQVEHTFKPCGHVSTIPCSVATLPSPSCPTICGIRIESCGHLCSNKCGVCNCSHTCGRFCERKLFCGHTCDRPCHRDECLPCEQPCCVSCVHSSCPKLCHDRCSSCVEPCDWQCDHQGSCNLVCGAPCNRLPCNERCKSTLGCGHRCPSLCGEACPSTAYCQTCCKEEKQTAIVDHVLMRSYSEVDVDEDPIVVLPCGHFFAVSTLDGHFGMGEVYERDGIDSITYTGTLPLQYADINEKPRTCPDCRAVAKSIYRYGRLFRLSELRALERKHGLAVQKELIECMQLYDKGATSHVKLLMRLGMLQKRLLKGPMARVYDACTLVSCSGEVPKPSCNLLIRLLELRGKAFAKSSDGVDDENEKMALDALYKAIGLANESLSLHTEARLRLTVVAILAKGTFPEGKRKDEAVAHLNWVITNANGFDDFVAQAERLKKSISLDMEEVAEVMRVVSVAASGYPYGTSWSSHWYECPNGHPYYIGECGGAMESSRCIECGAAVGGGGHSLNASNRQVGGLYEEALNTLSMRTL